MPATSEELLARLRELSIEFTQHEHAALRTVQQSRQLRPSLPGAHCKNLFLKDKKGQYWLVVAQEVRPVDLKALPAQIGAARLSFGRAERLLEVLGVEPGAVTPFALINDPEHRVRVVIDAAIFDHEFANFHPLINTATITIRSEDLRRFVTAMGHQMQQI